MAVSYGATDPESASNPPTTPTSPSRSHSFTKPILYISSVALLVCSIFLIVNPPPAANRDNRSFDAATLASSSCSAGLPPHGVSGFFDLPGTDESYFYYFAAARDRPMKEAPLVLWMSGGPGCSSLLGALMENGPCRVRRGEDGVPIAEPNEFGWDGSANVLWVDQPAGVGFSHSGSEEDDTSDMYSYDQVATKMLALLHRWQERFPGSHNGELFVFAESFGGHYAPAVARHYFDAERSGKAVPGLSLKGVGVGNGLTNPAIQYQYSAEFAFKNTYGIEAVNRSAYDKMLAAVPSCEEKIASCNEAGSKEGCVDAFMYCNNALTVPYVKSGRNIYDVRTMGDFKDDMAAVSEFVSSERISKALDARSQPFNACNMDVYLRFLDDWMKEYDTALPEMLKHGVDILIYAGDADFVCNWMGNLAWVKALQWEGQEEFNGGGMQKFVLEDGSVGGEGRTAKGKDTGRLSFLRIYEAGHLAPKDQPYATQQMINRFIADGDVGV